MTVVFTSAVVGGFLLPAASARACRTRDGTKRATSSTGTKPGLTFRSLRMLRASQIVSLTLFSLRSKVAQRDLPAIWASTLRNDSSFGLCIFYDARRRRPSFAARRHMSWPLFT